MADFSILRPSDCTSCPKPREVAQPEGRSAVNPHNKRALTSRPFLILWTITLPPVAKEPATAGPRV